MTKSSLESSLLAVTTELKYELVFLDLINVRVFSVLGNLLTAYIAYGYSAIAGLSTIPVGTQNESYFLKKLRKRNMRGRQVVLEEKSAWILLFYSFKREEEKEISKKKMKNIVETELKLCVLSRM
jgi:hypothetical protein